MQTKIKFYKDRVAVNFLAKDKKNGADVFNAIDGYTAIGVLSKQFDTVEEGIEYVKDYMKDVPVVSVGLGAGDPAQFQKAALIAAATDPGHVNQVFTGAAYAAGALKAMKAENTAVNVLMSPTGIVGKVKISTGELSSKEKPAIIDVDTAMAMVLDMRAQGIKYFPMGGLKSKDELKAVAEACARHGVPMMEPSGGVDLSNFKEITKICLDAGVEKVMPHIYGAVIDKESGNTKIEDVKAVYQMVKELLD